MSARLTRVLLVSSPAFVAVALLLVGIETGWAPVHRLDTSSANGMHSFALEHPVWVRTMLTVSDVGSPTVMRVLSGVLAVVLWWRRARRLALWIVATMAVGALIDTVVKSAVGRERPHLPHPVALATGGSFPSGHAFAATLGAGVFLVWALPLLSPRGRVVAWIAAVLVPIVVGVSRIALGVHWTSDVVGGWLLGIALLASTVVAFDLAPGNNEAATGPDTDAGRG